MYILFLKITDEWPPLAEGYFSPGSFVGKDHLYSMKLYTWIVFTLLPSSNPPNTIILSSHTPAVCWSLGVG